MAVLLWMNLGPRPTATAPGVLTPSNGSPPAPRLDAQRSSTAARKKTNAPAKKESDAARANGPSVGSRPAVTLWRASEPPDLSSITSSDRLNIESACSYAKTQSQDEYNGCLARQLAVHGTTPPPSDLSGLSASQRQAIESACATTKLVQGPAAYNHCIAQQLEMLKRSAQ